MQILKFDQLDSTNNYAKTLIKEGKAKNGDIVYAVAQTAGRGQSTNIWESETGKNLTFSLIIQPKHIEPKNQFLISQAVSVGIVKYLKCMGGCKTRPYNIKWPNDIFVGMKKIAGILIENTIQGNQVLFSVIGVGLNVNQTEFSKNAGNPTSLSLINKAQYDLETELEELVMLIESELDFLKFDNGKDCQTRYLEHLLFFNEEREYNVYVGTDCKSAPANPDISAGSMSAPAKKEWRKITGKIIGVNGFGFLQIQTKTGTIFECDIKEIVYVL